MSLDEVYKHILFLFYEYRYNNYIESLSYLYERYYELLKKEDEKIAEKVLSSTTTILSFINGEKLGSELFIDNVSFPDFIIQNKDVFYRARTVESEVKENEFKAQNMFHIPLGMNKTQSGRFDDINRICLYLSKSSFSCFCEIPEEKGKSLMISLFKFNHSTSISQIVDLRLKSETDFNKLKLESKKNYLLCLPYILACMFIKRGPLEYLFPQYVMSVLDYKDERLQKKHDGNKNNVYTPYIGLSYTSVNFDNEVKRIENNEQLYDNYVFLAKYGRDNTGTSKLLGNMFLVTNPKKCNWDQKSDYKEIEDSLKSRDCYKIE